MGGKVEKRGREEGKTFEGRYGLEKQRLPTTL